MDYRNIDIYNELSLKERKEFLLLTIGLHFFTKNKKTIKHTSYSFSKHFSNDDGILGKRLSFRVEVLDDGYLFIAYDGQNDVIYAKKRDGQTQIINPRNFEFNLSDQIVCLLLDAVRNNVERESEPKRIIELHELKPDNFFYKFILGAGVSNKNDYNGLSWKEFESLFEDAIDGVFGVRGVSKTMVNSVFNTNYGVFQLVKDIEYDEYVKLLYHFVTHLNEPNTMDDTTLSAIVDVIDKQSELVNHQTVVTFNYDDLFEDLYKQKHGDMISVCCKMNGFLDDESLPLSIYHPHGYVPVKDVKESFRSFMNDYLKSIVLTTDEYIDAYSTPAADGYRVLYKQLDETCCFVGNSITDYEEQKVIKKHFDKNPSSFHFAFFQTDNFSKHDVLYKTIFMLKIGIIPLWYYNYEDIKKEIKRASLR